MPSPTRNDMNHWRASHLEVEELVDAAPLHRRAPRLPDHKLSGCVSFTITTLTVSALPSVGRTSLQMMKKSLNGAYILLNRSTRIRTGDPLLHNTGPAESLKFMTENPSMRSLWRRSGPPAPRQTAARLPVRQARVPDDASGPPPPVGLRPCPPDDCGVTLTRAGLVALLDDDDGSVVSAKHRVSDRSARRLRHPERLKRIEDVLEAT